jgi:hypothetical protein
MVVGRILPSPSSPRPDQPKIGGGEKPEMLAEEEETEEEGEGSFSGIHQSRKGKRRLMPVRAGVAMASGEFRLLRMLLQT